MIKATETKKYQYPPISNHRNIYGQYINQNPIGFCYNRSHRGALTPQMYKKHKCAKKNCPFFHKNENHPHWKRKRKRKQEEELMKCLKKPEF